MASLKKVFVRKNQIVNQHRYPILKFNWPIYMAAKSLIDEKFNKKNAIKILKKFVLLRKKMKVLGDLYGSNILDDYSINSIFFPWFNGFPDISTPLNMHPIRQIFLLF